MQKLLTIVIPTYNMQAYLNRCLDSLIVDDERMKKLEVLVVNDGSKDDSSAIAHGYESRFPDTYRVIDKENGNYGSCVNRGLAEARGRFIKILDADDWFDTTQFALYLARLEETGDEIDMVLTDYVKVDADGLVIGGYKFPIEYDAVFSFQDYSGLDYFAHHALTYRTDLLREHGYNQTERISYTDNEWMYFPQLFVEKCVYWNLDVYRYLIGREGQTMDPKVQMKSSSQVITILKRMVSVLNAHKEMLDQGRMGAVRLYSFILHTSKGIYQTFLVKMANGDFQPEILESYDAFLLGHHKEIYDRIGNELVLKGIPIHYVRFWRRFHKRFPVDFLRTAYRKIRYKG